MKWETSSLLSSSVTSVKSQPLTSSLGPKFRAGHCILRLKLSLSSGPLQVANTRLQLELSASLETPKAFLFGVRLSLGLTGNSALFSEHTLSDGSRSHPSIRPHKSVYYFKLRGLSLNGPHT